MKNLFTSFIGKMCRPVLAMAGLLAAGTAAQAQRFAPAVTYSTGTNSQPRDIAVGDVNGDGRLDLVVAGAGGGSAGVGVMLGQSGGGYGNATYYAVNNLPGTMAAERVALTDVNLDGRLDIVSINIVSNSTFGPIGVLLGQAGGFAPGVAYQTGGNYLQAIALGDINNDLIVDIVGAHEYSGDVVTLTNQLSGGFSMPASTTLGPNSRPKYVCLADLSNDGFLDVVTAHPVTGGVRVLAGLSTGFGAVTTYLPNRLDITSVAVDDLNGDGLPDLIICDAGTLSIGVMPGLAAGGFGALSSYPLGPDTYPLEVATGDINGDGRPDVVAVCNGPNSTSVALLESQPGGLGPVAIHPVPGTGTMPSFLSLALADLNQDGRLDAVVSDSDANLASVLLNASSTVPPLRLANASASIGGSIALNGTNLAGATLVTFTGAGSATVASGFTVNAAGTQITGVVVPAGAQTGPVSVTTPRGTVTSSVAFRVTAPLAARLTGHSAALEVYPSPAHQRVTLLLPPLAAPTATLTLRDALGRALRSEKLALPGGSLRHEFSLVGLTPGSYTMHVQAGPAVAVCRLVVE